MGQAGEREDAADGGGGERADALVFVQLCCCELRAGGEVEGGERKGGREERERRQREQERERKGSGGGERDQEKEKQKACAWGREDAAEGVPWFGNSRGVAVLECGESASGSQEVDGRLVPGHNNSLSVALTRSGLSTPRNTKFTQAQNAALLQCAQPNSYCCVCAAPASIMGN